MTADNVTRSLPTDSGLPHHLSSSVSHHSEASQLDSDFEDWDDNDDDDNNLDMPSDLRPALGRLHTGGKSQTPLLSGKGGSGYDSPPVRPALVQRRSTFREQDPEVSAKNATRQRYIYATFFLVLSLISFVIQTETAVYIQHNLHWNKAYCML